MKSRFTAIDVRAIACNLNTKLVGSRLQNIYDVNSKTFLLKFQKTNFKAMVLIESGIRMHTTETSYERISIPSQFCMKLRKHLGSRKVTAVRQLGGLDRVIDVEFAVAAGNTEEGTLHLIVEFYASGNVILTDHKFTIITLLRVLKKKRLNGQDNEEADESKDKDKDTDLEYMVGTRYEIAKSTGNTGEEKEGEGEGEEDEGQELGIVSREKLCRALLPSPTQKISKNTTSSAKESATLKKLLVRGIGGGYGAVLVEHAILAAELEPSMRITPEFDCSVDSPTICRLEQEFNNIRESVKLMKTVDPKGYVYSHHKDDGDEDKDTAGDKGSENDKTKTVIGYTDYQPINFKRSVKMYSKRFGTFSEAVDKFYSVIEESKRTNRERAQTNVKDKKLRAIKHEQEQRIKALVELQRVSGMKAEIINENLEQTDQILTLINTLLAAEIDWEELEELVQDQKKAGHVIARDIEGLDLKKNVVKVNFTNSQETTKTVIDLDLNLSAHGNVRQYYEVKKAAAIKEEKTKRAADQAIKRATAKIYGNKKSGAVSLHNQQAILSEKKQLLRNRKIMWFEKFNWFISSDGYLVLGGKDMQQNEMLVRKYMRAHDVYVHADVHGACSVIVLNNASSSSSSSPPPLIKPSTLIQAGSMAMCYSKAWESKIITSAYWVHSNQVSKTAPTGEYLSTGSFMVRGKKNYLPPSNLVYGFGILFKLLNPISTNKSEPDVLDQQQTISSSITEGDNESVSVYDQYDELREKYNLDSVDENAQIEAQRLPSFLKQSDIASLNIPSEHPILPSTSKKNGSKSKQSSSNTDNKKQAAAAAAAASKKKKEKNPKYSSKQKRGHNNDQEYDSDDVERNLIKMELLGKNKKGENKQKKSSKHSNKSSVASTLPKKTFNNSLSRNQPEKSTSDGIDTLNAESAKPLEQPQQPKQPQPQPQQPKQQQQQQQQQGEGQGENEELVAAVETFSNNENQEFLNSLCPNPNINPESDNNQILYAIPVMAPYSTLQLANYKYKAKLYPGNMKKGAISKTINALFTKNNKDLEELTCIRSMFEVNADLVLNTIISKSRVESNINDSGKGGKSSKGQKKSNSKKK